MTDAELAELEAREKSAWLKVKECEDTILKPLNDAWHPLYQELQKALIRREIEREMEGK